MAARRVEFAGDPFRDRQCPESPRDAPLVAKLPICGEGLLRVRPARAVGVGGVRRVFRGCKPEVVQGVGQGATVSRLVRRGESVAIVNVRQPHVSPPVGDRACCPERPGAQPSRLRIDSARPEGARSAFGRLMQVAADLPEAPQARD